MQVEVHRLAVPAHRADDVLHVAQRAADGVLNIRDQAGQPLIGRAQPGQGQVRVASREPGAGLPDAEVPDVDASS